MYVWSHVAILLIDLIVGGCHHCNFCKEPSLLITAIIFYDILLALSPPVTVVFIVALSLLTDPKSSFYISKVYLAE